MYIQKTVFVSTEVPLCGHTIHIDSNSKSTASNGDFFNPKPNAFSLPPVSTCPGSTAKCRKDCYVQGLAKFSPEVFATYTTNERVLHILLEQGPETGAQELGEWIAEHCKGGFRWHVSGDIFSRDHAQWIANVCNNSPEVRHWIYTRSFFAVPLLTAQAKNLTVNISADADNLDLAARVAAVYPVRLTYFSHDGSLPDLPDDSIIFPNYSVRGRDLDEPTSHPWWQGLSQRERKMVCPTDFFGQSEVHRCGPCDKCLKPLQ